MTGITRAAVSGRLGTALELMDFPLHSSIPAFRGPETRGRDPVQREDAR